MRAPAALERVFSRELCGSEIPSPAEKILEVKVMWGPQVLATRHLRPGESFTIGDRPDADLRLSSAGLGEELFPLVSPGGIRGHIISVVEGMRLDRTTNDRTEKFSCPSGRGALHSHVLSVGECWKVGLGQLSFMVAYTRPARGIRSGFFKGADFGLARWFAVCLLVAIGLWTLIQITPPAKRGISDYMINPQRFAITAPFAPNSSKKTFERIEKKIIEPSKADSQEWNRAKSRSGNARQLPRETKDQRDRRVVASIGLFKFLKEKAAGGGNGGNAYGGTQIQNVEQQLDELPGPSSPDSGGVGSLRGGGGGPGVGGEDLLPAGTHGYGNDERVTAVNVLVRGKRRISVVRPKKPPTTVVGGLTQQVVGEYLGRRWSEFKYCYEQGLHHDPNMYGKVAVTFTIGPDGRVTQAEILQASLDDSNVQQCVLRTVRHIRFPKPRGGGEVIVTYPFLFTTSG